LRTTGLEIDSARNNIHPSNKHKPDVANKNTRKLTCKYGQPGCVKVAWKHMSLLSLKLSGALVNATALTLLLESCAKKSDSVATF